MWLRLLLLVLPALLQPSKALGTRTLPPLPDEDPFYTAPPGWEKAALGTVFRSRSVEIHDLFAIHVKEAWQLLYRTTYTSNDEPSTTVTTVLIPHGAKKDNLVLYAEYQDSNGPKCMPSYSYRAGVSADVTETLNMATVLVFLQEGYVVTIPDKQGKRNAFAAGHIEGRQTLDGIRATLSFKPLDFSKDTRVAGWGYSGGGIQSGWAASLKRKYAPELNMVGWYSGGTPSNLTNLIVRANKSFFSGFLISGLLGISLAYPSVYDTLEKNGTEKLKEGIKYAKSHCQLEMLVKYPFQDLLSREYTSAGEHLLELEPVKNALQKQVMGVHEDETPDVPVLMAHGTSDEIAPYESAFKTYKNWCSHGAQVEFITFQNKFSGHFITQLTSVAPSFEWIRDYLNGKPTKKNCSHSINKSVAINPNYLGRQSKDILEILSGLLGSKIGPGDVLLKKKIDASR